LKTPKKSIIKYFSPVDISGVLGQEMKDMDIGESFGYFARMSHKDKLFLNRYSIKDMMSIMDKVGMLQYLERKGLSVPLVELDLDDSMSFYFKLYDSDKTPENLLIDLRLSDTRFVPEKRFFEEKHVLSTLDRIVIEWLSIQNPRGKFQKDRPQLPGQSRPGLGCLGFLMDMMHTVAEGVIKDGFMDIPAHMHGAIMYSKNFMFFNPAHEGVMRAILRDLKKYPLYDISWGMITGTIIDKETGMPQVSDPSEQIFPVSRRLKEYYTSSKYRKKFKEIYKIKKYRFDYEEMNRRRAEIIQSKSIADL